MKITKLDIHIQKSPPAEPFAFSQGWVKQRVACLVEISTDEGITGWGEAFAQGLGQTHTTPKCYGARCVTPPAIMGVKAR